MGWSRLSPVPPEAAASADSLAALSAALAVHRQPINPLPKQLAPSDIAAPLQLLHARKHDVECVCTALVACHI